MTENKEKMLEIFIAKNLFAKDMSALAKTLGYASSGSRQGLYDAYNSKATVGQIEDLWNRFEKLGYSGFFLYHFGQAYLDYQKLKKILGKDDIFHYLLKWWNGEYIDLTEFSVPKKEKIQEINLSESHEYLSVLLAFSFLGRESYDDFWKSDTKQMLNTFIKNVAQEYPEFRFLEFYFNTNVELLDSPAKFIYFIINILNETKNKRNYKLIKYWDKETLWMTEKSLDNSEIYFYLLLYSDTENYQGYVCISCHISCKKEYDVKIIGFLAFMEIPGTGEVCLLYKNREEKLISKYCTDNERKKITLFFEEPLTFYQVEIKRNSNNMYDGTWMYEIEKFVDDINVWETIENRMKLFSQNFWEQAPKESSVQVRKVISDRDFIYINMGNNGCNYWYKVNLKEYSWLKDIKDINDVAIMEKEDRLFLNWKNHLYYLYIDECIMTSQEEIIKEIFS